MRINLHTKGFDLTSHTRGFVESRLLSALGQVSVHIESVAVHLEASRGRTQPDAAVCLIVVSLHPSGEVRSRAEHFWLHVAIDRAAVNVGGEVEREVMRSRQAAASPSVVGDRRHDSALEAMLDDGPTPHHQRELLERPENHLWAVPVHERWRLPGTEDEDDFPAVRRSVPDHGSKSERRRWSRSLSRVR